MSLMALLSLALLFLFTLTSYVPMALLSLALFTLTLTSYVPSWPYCPWPYCSYSP